MLRITQQDSAGGAKQYYSKADYLSDGQELVGSWGGKAAELLGLAGIVDKQSFDRLCDNLHPTTNQQLTARTRSDRTVGYDFTFSVPKSVSLLYALGEDKEILDAFKAAVEETMHENIEPEMKTRVRRGGKNEERTTGNAVWATFYHTTSRPVDGIPDPQLHAHCFVFNSTWDAKEQRWKAGQFRDLKASGPLFQAMFRVRLANKLQDLGYGITRKRDDFEIAGMSQAVLKRYSRRTEQIEEVAKEKGITNPDLKAELGKETREAKNHELSWDELRADWLGRLSDAERNAVASVEWRGVAAARQFRQEKAAVDYAIEHCQARDATMSERKVLTEALKQGLGSVTIRDVTRELDKRPLIRAVVNGKMFVATREMKKAEAAVVRFARQGRGRFRPMGDPDRKCNRDWLNAGQKAAVRHVLASRDRVTLVRGPAGTGKTTMEEELGEALKDAGLPVVALAQTNSAVHVLRTEAHIEDAETVARFLKDKKMQALAQDGVVLVDEGSLLGTRDMVALFELCQEANARVILVGDTLQNRAVSAGEPMRLLELRAGLKVSEVTEIIRQSGDYAKAAKALSEGRTADGFDELDRLKWIKEIPDVERYRAMADAYLATIRERKRNGEYKTALAVSPTWAEAGRIAQAIRDGLKSQKKLGQERTLDIWVPAHLTDAQKGDDAGWIGIGDLLKFHQNAPGYKNGARVTVSEGMKLPVESAKRFEVFRPSQLTVAVGDRIRYTSNGKTKDGKHVLQNGGLATVRAFTPKGDLVVDDGWVIGKDWGHIAQGYAVSSENSQGRTVDKVFVGLSSQSFGAANERRFYVPATRGREQAMIFTDNKKELLKAVQKPDRPMSATELAEARRRQSPLRQRLKKHLSFMRRLGAFTQTHGGRSGEGRVREQLQQERTYAR